MTNKFGYSPVSLVAAGCGAIAAAVAASNHVTAPLAANIGAVASAIVGGVQLNNSEKVIKEEIDEALKNVWTTIDDKYRFSYNSEKCLSELKQELMGGNTSADEVIRNLENEELQNTLFFVIKNILVKYRDELNKDAEINWDDVFIENAAKDIAVNIINAIKSVFDEDNNFLILKSIAEGIVREIKESERRLAKEIRNQKPDLVTIPCALTTIPTNINLIGRDKDINTINSLLQRKNILSIYAYGGVGKTAVATSIINEIKNDVFSGKSSFKHVAWVTSSGNLKSDITALSIPSVNKMKTQEEKFQAASTFLQNTPTFLVIDNVDTPLSREETDDLTTFTGVTKVLITTRVDIEGVEKYQLNELDIEDALELFFRHYTTDERINELKERFDYSFAKMIVDAVTRNALFIELIAKMAYSEHKALEELWSVLCKDVFSINSKYRVSTVHGDDGKMLKHIQNLYNMSNLSKHQKEIMSFIALFPSEYCIFFDVFKWAGFEDDEVDNLGELQKRGWIERRDEGYLIHTMVKGSIEQQEKCDFDEERYENLIIELGHTHQYIPDNMVYTKVQERLIIVDTICGLLADKGEDSINIAGLFNNVANVHCNQGNYDKALEYIKKALEIYEKMKVKEHPATASTYSSIARVYRAQGKYNEALMYNETALQIREKVLGKQHPDTACTYDNMAIVYHNQGNLVKALKYHMKAIEIIENVLGKENRETARIYDRIANVYYDQGNYDESLDYHMKALKIIEEMRGEEQPDIASIYGNIANVHYAQGHYDEALEYNEKAQFIFEKLLGKKHPDTARTYSNIARVYYAQHKYDKALEYNERALKINEEVLGKKHPDIASTYSNMAALYRNQGNYDKALKYQKKVLEIQEEVKGKRHPDIVGEYSNMVILYRDQGNYDKALEYQKKALEIQEEVIGKKHPDTACMYEYMGHLYYYLENNDKALEYYNRALEIQEKIRGKEHPDTAGMYVNLANVYLAQGNYDNALEYQKKALEILKKVRGKEHPDTADIYATLANVYFVQGNYDKAVEYHKKALEIREKVLGDEHSDTVSTFINMANVYYAEGNYKLAMKYFEKALDFFVVKEGENHQITKMVRKKVDLLRSLGY